MIGMFKTYTYGTELVRMSDCDKKRRKLDKELRRLESMSKAAREFIVKSKVELDD
jgi:hypothetical protein